MKHENCPFCRDHEPLLASNEHAFAISNKRPVSRGHSLVVSRAHVPTIFDLSAPEYSACFELVRKVKKLVSQEQHR